MPRVLSASFRGEHLTIFFKILTETYNCQFKYKIRWLLSCDTSPLKALDSRQTANLAYITALVTYPDGSVMWTRLTTVGPPNHQLCFISHKESSPFPDSRDIGVVKKFKTETISFRFLLSAGDEKRRESLVLRRRSPNRFDREGGN